MATGYHIYANAGAGDAIDYSVPVATASALTWTSSELSYPGTWSFGVRAFDTVSVYEEQNLDCAVTMTLGPSGQDISNRPPSPTGLRAFGIAGGSIRVEWASLACDRAKLPTGFHVYAGTGGAPNYTAPAATVTVMSGIADAFAVTLSGLTDGVRYTIGVRAFNITAEESNTNTVTATALATGPLSVDSVLAIATSHG